MRGRLEEGREALNPLFHRSRVGDVACFFTRVRVVAAATCGGREAPNLESKARVLSSDPQS